MRILHRVLGALLAIYYLNILVAVALSFLNIGVYVLPAISLTILMVLYFLLMFVQSYKQDPKRIYPILFLVMIGIILVFPQYTFLNIFFLITYSFMYTQRDPLSIPLSYIAIGNFVINFFLPVGIIVVTYGWIQYAIKKPVQ